MNKTWTTGTRAWAAAEQINTTKAVKCSEWRGRVSGHGFSSENSSSGKKCQLHPHYREREEGSPWGMYSHNHRGLQTNHQLLGESGFVFLFFLTNASLVLNENLNFRDISKVLISNWLWEMGPCIHIKQVKPLYCCKRVLSHMLQVQHFISTQGPKSQQWLQVQCRITFKTLLLVHKPLNGLAPPVHLWLALRSLFNPIRPLRSADLLAIPKIRFKCAQVLQLLWSCCLEQASHWLEVNYNYVYMQKQTQTMLSSQAYS